MINEIVRSFQTRLPCFWNPTREQIEILEQLIWFAEKNRAKITKDYDVIFTEAVNQKLALNNDVYKRILDEAFFEKIKLNYIYKARIKSLLDCADVESYCNFLRSNDIYTESMIHAFQPVSKQVTYQALIDIANNDKQYDAVFCSVFSRFCFNLFPKECSYSFFSGKMHISSDYFEFINELYPDLGNRSDALCIIDVSKSLFNNGYVEGCNCVLNAIKETYCALNNHCVMAIIIPPIMVDATDCQWRLYADCILFAEKHLKDKIDKTYFRWKKIGSQTIEYIKQIVPFNAEFEYAFQGFVFKDCFIVENTDEPYSLLLIFEKNERDERILHCPACRTQNVQGNSYPILNVRSWECENSLCPDRSKYNRGKRYAYMSLFRQKEMMNDDNIIPAVSISKWHLDCQRQATKDEMLEMVIRHYSCAGDGISIVTDLNLCGDMFGRKIVSNGFSIPKTNLLSNFKNSTYFYRYLHYDDKKAKSVSEYAHRKAKIIYGDALDALRGISDKVFSGAVTSPPYYNAKSYSQWPNIYCYLYDMYNINQEVFRTLKEGGVYLYNIFDYFDNENNIVLSAMGNKRMILGAYMIDMFERIGFTVCGNIIWDKGEIQGNRSFNQGNFTPYYQAPLNCWEHILILSKGKIDKQYDTLSSCIKDIRPVIKMIKGKNVLGHEAPYPGNIPELILKHMTEKDIVLDPFLGSGTTCILANEYRVNSVGIEKNEKYFELCKSFITKGS